MYVYERERVPESSREFQRVPERESSRERVPEREREFQRKRERESVCVHTWDCVECEKERMRWSLCLPFSLSFSPVPFRVRVSSLESCFRGST
jgi:hypothetical protein